MGVVAGIETGLSWNPRSFWGRVKVGERGESSVRDLRSRQVVLVPVKIDAIFGLHADVGRAGIPER